MTILVIIINHQLSIELLLWVFRPFAQKALNKTTCDCQDIPSKMCKHLPGSVLFTMASLLCTPDLFLCQKSLNWFFFSCCIKHHPMRTVFLVLVSCKMTYREIFFFLLFCYRLPSYAPNAHFLSELSRQPIFVAEPWQKLQALVI